MKKPVLIEKTVEHASINLLLLLNLRLFEPLHCFNELHDFLVNLMRLS
jgi:hypothetical protein